jgi:hypothetical protein
MQPFISLIGEIVMELERQMQREGFDMRVVWALRMVGVNLGSHLWRAGCRKGHKITFTFHGHRDMAVGVLTDFIEDEYNGINCRFFSEQARPGQCYVLFDEGRTPR